MPLLTREAILKAEDLPIEEIEVPEWGGTVRIRSLMGDERDKFEGSIIRGTGRNMTMVMNGMRAKLVAMSVVDEEGKRLFTEEDIKTLGRKSAKALDRVFSVAQRLSGISDTDVEQLKQNLEKAQSESSDSA